MSDNTYIARDIPRDAVGAPCRCNGFADKIDERPTTEEIRLHDCGRIWACCTAVFKCRLCGLRFIGKLDAPEW